MLFKTYINLNMLFYSVELYITEKTSTINGILNSTSEAQTSANPSPSSVKHITLGKQTYIHKVVITLEN